MFKFLRPGMRETGYIREVRPDGKISLSLQPPPEQVRDSLGEQILDQLRDNGGSLPLGDKSDPELIAQRFGVSKGNFKKAIGGLYKQGLIRIQDEQIDLT